MHAAGGDDVTAAAGDDDVAAAGVNDDAAANWPHYYRHQPCHSNVVCHHNDDADCWMTVSWDWAHCVHSVAFVCHVACMVS